MPQNKEIELNTTLDPERYNREIPSYLESWKDDVEIRFGTVYESLSGPSVEPYFGTDIVSGIGAGTWFDSVGLARYLVDGREIEAIGYGGGTTLRTNVLRITERVISVEEYARLALEMHRATVRRWGEETIRAAGYTVEDSHEREHLLQLVREALAEVKKGSRVLPGYDHSNPDKELSAPSQPLPNLSIE
jgi:hypothetical protein